MARERGIRSNFACASKEDACAWEGGKGRAQRVKKDHKGRTEECAAKERQAWTCARGKWPIAMYV